MSGVEALAKYVNDKSKLTKLVLSYNEIGDNGARALGEALKKNKSLKDLNLNKCGIGTEGGRALAAALGKAVLTECSLLKNELDVESATMLAKIGTEKRIMLSGMRQDQTMADFSEQMLSPADAILIASDLTFMEVLTHLDLSDNTLTNDGQDMSGILAIAEALKSGTAVLTSIDVGANNLNEEAALGIVRAARQHDRMTFLGLRACEIGPAGAKEIAEYISVTAVLKKLDLSSNNLTHYGTDMSGILEIAEALKALKPGMAQCWLLGNKIDVETATRLAEIGKEKKIMLSGIKTHQTEADFRGKDLRPADAILIASDLPSMALTSLDLSSNSLCGLNLVGLGTYEPSGIEALASALDNAVLTTLSLRGNIIWPDGARALANALASDSAKLKNLTLSHSNITNDGAIAIGEALKTNSTLEELSLFRCEIDAEGGKAIGVGLQTGIAVLNKLELSDNNIEDEGAIALGKALKKNKSLTELMLNTCNIGPNGVIALAAALSESTAVLKKLALSYNNIGDKGATAIGNALKTNSTLEELWLINCEIGLGGKKLAAALSQGAMALTNLDVRLNSLTNEDTEALQEAARGRTDFELSV